MKKRLIACLLLLSLLLVGCSVKPDGDVPYRCSDHADTNNDGSCDWCRCSVITTVDFYSINDLHGKLADGDSHPGVDELTTYIKNAQDTDDHVVLISAGDMWQGSSESNLTYGRIIVDWMNEMGFSAMALGNHEFDWGESYIENNEAAANFPFLAINVYDRQTDAQVEYCRSSTVVEAGGVQIGIIGAIGDCYSSISSDKVTDVYFKTGKDLTALVKAESDKLREQGVDFVIYVLHDGSSKNTGTSSTVLSSSQLSSYYDVSLSDGYVDLVFEAHTHQQYLAVDGNGVYHLQNRGDNKGGISHVEITFNIANGTWNVSTRELVLTSQYEKLTDDRIVQDLLEKYDELISPANQVLGMNGVQRSSNALSQLVAQLYYKTGVERWGGEYEIVLGGGYLKPRSPYTLTSGQVKYGQLQSLFPFDNDIVLCSIKGSDLLSKFINSSYDSYFVSGDPELITNVDPNGIYYIVVDSYTSAYAPNRLTVVETYDSGVYARDLLAEHIRQGGLA